MTCGYVCPQCEGSGRMPDGEPCDYCSPAINPEAMKVQENEEKHTHEVEGD